MQPRLLAFLIGPMALAALLAGCAKPAAPAAEAPAQLPAHLGPPPASLCTVAPFHVADGGTASISMVVSNDGGYCAASLVASGGQPFDAALVPAKPLHGDDEVIRYNERTSIEYVSRPGYVGRDAFTVRLILKGRSGYTTLTVGVDVQPAGAGAKTS